MTLVRVSSREVGGQRPHSVALSINKRSGVFCWKCFLSPLTPAMSSAAVDHGCSYCVGEALWESGADPESCWVRSEG